MSFVAGSVAGALISGGVYYGFSNLIQTRTTEHRSDLHNLSERLVTASSVVPSPSPASTRIAHRPFLALIQSRWNEELASAFSAVTRWERHASEWGRKMLYGERP
ncbi:hypothetical protein SCLCIDRAFT_1216785 [Scleroderma citrinum Foug A]|uniref:MICOS complex subunit MIC12 n=1 Tax=Scleroderma citrinum Foug A TaxID=1036808 RepID=A0A0C3DIH2_9AGAM|nr:hypothetical protein SCLCIDRAFT_1216785 [Scleroderma citrinum Foug A]